MQHWIYRLLDNLISIFIILALWPVMIIILMIGILETGSPLFFQPRVGRNGKAFTLVKFRSMPKNMEHVPTHFLSREATTPVGYYLRKFKLDELPQVWNVLKGEMSLVGPRPSLFTQVDVIEERTKRNVLDVKPGITGLAQINNIDMSTPELLAQTDAEMIRTMSVKNYFKYIFLTVLGKGRGDRIRS